MVCSENTNVLRLGLLDHALDLCKLSSLLRDPLSLNFSVLIIVVAFRCCLFQEATYWSRRLQLPFIHGIVPIRVLPFIRKSEGVVIARNQFVGEYMGRKERSSLVLFVRRGQTNLPGRKTKSKGR